MENQNSKQESLPKPQTDLPLPEKELPSHLASQGETLGGYGRKFPLPKYIFLGIVFVILLIIIAAAYFLGKNSNNNSVPIPSPGPVSYKPSPTPDLTADWKTYANEQYELSFKYPPVWRVKNPYSNQETVTLQSGIGLIPTNKNQGSAVTPLYIERYENPNKLDLKAWKDEYNSKREVHNTFFPSEQLEETLVAGNKAYTTEKGDCEPYLCYTAIILVDDKIFMFHAMDMDFVDFDMESGYSQEELRSYRAIFDQILSTFRFD